ncbi:unnamed protein product [Caenorhabditis brenneri]
MSTRPKRRSELQDTKRTYKYRAQQSSTAIAHANVPQLFDSQLKPAIGFPTFNQSSMINPSSSEGSSKSLKRKSLSIDGAPSSKHQKVTTKDDDEESIELIESNRSFNNVEQNMIDLESGASMEKDHCSLDKVISLYEKIALSEFRLSEHQDREVTLEEYLEVIDVKRITKTSHLPILRLSSDDKFQVLTGYQKTTMNFECKGVNGLVRKSISYMSCQDGCLVWNGSAVRHIEKYDYRTVAAKDFGVRCEELSYLGFSCLAVGKRGSD